MTDTTTTGWRCECGETGPHAPNSFFAPGVDGIDSTVRTCRGDRDVLGTYVAGFPAGEVRSETEALDALSRAFRRVVDSSEAAGWPLFGLDAVEVVVRFLDDTSTLMERVAEVSAWSTGLADFARSQYQREYGADR